MQSSQFYDCKHNFQPSERGGARKDIFTNHQLVTLMNDKAGYTGSVKYINVHTYIHRVPNKSVII